MVKKPTTGQVVFICLTIIPIVLATWIVIGLLIWYAWNPENFCQ